MSTAVFCITPNVEVFTLWRTQATILLGISCIYSNFAHFKDNSFTFLQEFSSLYRRVRRVLLVMSSRWPGRTKIFRFAIADSGQYEEVRNGK